MDKMVNGVLVSMTQSEIDQYEFVKAETESDLSANQWYNNRVNAYPPIGDQLDKIFHDGLDAWKADIQAIKDANPKSQE